jgi:hypothetical protein
MNAWLASVRLERGMKCLRCLKSLGLIDQHDRNAIPNRIAQPARVTEENGLLLPILECPFALGTNENLE